MNHLKDTAWDSGRNPADRIRPEREESACPAEQAGVTADCEAHQAGSELEQIASFTVDHNKLVPGLYYSRRDGSVVTFDLRFKKPNTGDLLTNAEMHSAEHLIATLLRNSADKEAVVYFGPMGCQTGFYFLFNNDLLSCEGAIELLKEVFAAAAVFEGEMPGRSAIECGNYVNLDVVLGKAVCKFYRDLIADWTVEKLSYES